MIIRKHPRHELFVSDCGRVFTPLMIEKKRSVRPDGYEVTSTGGRGHPIRRVHHLVLETFVGPCPSGYEARHLNGNPGDNRACNLAWGSRVEQIADQKRHGTFSRPPVLSGSMNPQYRGVFDGDNMARAIFVYRTCDKSLRSISNEFGVSRTHLRRQISRLGVQKEVGGHAG